MLGRVLDRFRAEYKIRKNRRWVRKAVEFFPNKVLGWFKAVRACLNLKFRRATDELAPEVSGLQVGTKVENPGDRSKQEERPTPPFPEWWTWSKEEPEDSGLFSLYRGRGLSVGQAGESLGELPPDITDWRRPEAIGGPHRVFEPARDNEGVPIPKRYRLKKFTWDIGSTIDAHASAFHRGLDLAPSLGHPEEVPQYSLSDILEHDPTFFERGGQLAGTDFLNEDGTPYRGWGIPPRVEESARSVGFTEGEALIYTLEF